MWLSSIALAIFATGAYGGKLGRLMEEPSELNLEDNESDEDTEAPESQATLFDGVKAGANPPTNVGFCSTDPCTASTGTDCCCWSNAGMIAHPSYPNPDQAENERKCETSPDMSAMDLIMMKDPGFSGTSGRYEALKAVAPVYNDRDLCCAFHIDDPIVLSLQSPTVEPLPPTTSWMPKPTLPPPPKSTPDPLLLQDSIAASMEKAASDYMDAAAAIHSTANDLESALASVKKEAEVNLAKKTFTNKLRGIIGHYVTESNKAVEALHGAIQ
jgi:hypothetical protein